MTYFRELPNVQYQSFLTNKQSSQDYLLVKNIFRRAKIRDDLQNVFTLFNKYQIVDGTRPELVAEEIYGSVEYDWVVIISAGITNLNDQWPLSNKDLYNFCKKKYGSDAKLNEVHHYETTEIKDSKGRLILPKNNIVDSNFKVSYYDNGFLYTNDQSLITYTKRTIFTDLSGTDTVRISVKQNDIVPGDTLLNGGVYIKILEVNETNIKLESPITANITANDILTFRKSSVSLIPNPVIGITNYEYETIKNNEKGLIYLLKPQYLQTVLRDMRRELFYDESSQYIDQQTIKTENTYNTLP